MSKYHSVKYLNLENFACVLIILGISIVPQLLNASPINYSGTFSDPAAFQVSHNGETTAFSEQNFSTRTISADIDATSLTITYKEMSYHASGFSISFIDSFTTGFGQTTDISTMLTFNEFSTGLINDVGPLSLTPGSGGVYDIATPACSSTNDCFQPMLISGTYEISGPSETHQGAFSTYVAAGSAFGSSPFSDFSLDTNGYPAELTLISAGFQSFGNSDTLIAGVIDGINYETAIDLALFVNSPSLLHPSSIPVPAAVWLFGSGLIGLIGIARRKKA